MAVGFGFLTLAIVTGVLWSHSAHGRYWSWNAKEWSALIGLVIYVVLLLARRRSGWGGRQAALLGVAGFAVVVFTFLWMNVFSPTDGRRARPVLFVFGVSHKTAPLAVREALAFPREHHGRDPLRLRTEAGLQEAMILSTCNRVEIYARADDDARAARRWPRSCRRSTAAPTGEIASSSYCLHGVGGDAIRTRSGWRPAWTRWWSASRRSWAR